MIRGFRHALVFLLLFSLILYTCMPVRLNAQIQTEKNEDSSGYLEVSTEHRGLEVTIDGQFKGLTPTGILALSPGSHRIVVSHPSRKNWLDQDWSEEVQIVPGDTVTVEVTFEKSYSINSEPYGADVFVDGEKVGETPLFIKLPGQESKQLKLSYQGYRDTTLTLSGDVARFVDIELTPEVQKPDLSVSDTVIGQQQSQSKKKLLLYSAIGLSVVSGTLALFFREKANDNYDQYLTTGDPSRFNAFYDDARKFDRFAAASFVTFQVGFVASFYLFLSITNR